LIGVGRALATLVSLSAAGKAITFTTADPTGSRFGEGAAWKREPRKYAVIALRNSPATPLPEGSSFWLRDTRTKRWKPLKRRTL
jgi:hypothetical protein